MPGPPSPAYCRRPGLAQRLLPPNGVDAEELILVSDGTLGHMQSSGPTGHTHRIGGMMGGMMFGHMGE